MTQLSEKSLFLPLIASLMMITGCNYSISLSMAHTEGTASDTIDDVKSTQTNVNPDISIIP